MNADLTPVARRAFVTGATVVGIEALAYAVVLPHLPAVVGQDSPWWTVGVLFGSYSLAQLTALGPLGRLAERYGVRRVVAGCLLGTAAGLVLTAVSTNFWILLAGRVIDGASAGTVFVVTATTLARFSPELWPRILGGLGATRGAAALAGVTISAAIGAVLIDAGSSLTTTAWLGTGLALVALAAVRSLSPIPERSDDAGPRAGGSRASRRALAGHVSVQAALAGAVLLAPAAASTLVSPTAALGAPVVTIVGIGIGQLFLAGRVGTVVVRAAVPMLLVAGVIAASFASTVLLGFGVLGTAVGAYAPRAQAALIEWRVAEGDSDLAANAFAGRGSILGQIGGPIAGYIGLTWSATAATGVLAVLGAGAARARRPRAS